MVSRRVMSAALVAMLVMLGPDLSAAAKTDLPNSPLPSPPMAAPGTLLRDGTSLYPRAIRLEHSGSANGRIIADVVTFAGGRGQGAIYESQDGGVTFAQIGEINDVDAANRRGLCCASIYELPTRVGRLPAGTLLWAGTTGASVPDRRVQTRLWASRDHGRTWSFLATVASAHNALGMWEPELAVSANGQLVCVLSDETQQPAHGQTLVRSVSSDGVNWSAPVNLVALPDTAARAGMAVIRVLPNRTYYMTYEICGSNFGCAVYYRVSADGVSWGSPEDPGRRIQTVNGRYFAHTPTIAWVDSGTANGRLALVGQILYEADGSVAVDNGNAVFVNTENGTGSWYEIAAPVAVSDPADNYCSNYSSTLVQSVDGGTLLEFASDFAADGRCKSYYATASYATASGLGTRHAVR